MGIRTQNMKTTEIYHWDFWNQEYELH